MRLLGDLARLNARRFGPRQAVIFEDRHLTFADLDLSARRIATHLARRGVAVGDRVAMLSENCLEFLPAYFAIVRLGAICVPLNFRCAPAELEYMLSDCGARMLLHTPAYAELASGLITRFAPRPELLMLDDALLKLAGEDDSTAARGLSGEEAAVVMYTSGTTGRPKGVVLSHRSLLEQAAGTALATGARPRDRVLITVPLFHGSGLYVTGHSHLYVGASIVLARKFAAEEQIYLIERHGVTTFFGVPTQYALMLDATEEGSILPGHLRNGWYGGAPMPADLLRRAQLRWPGIRFQQLYGQTETTVTTVLSADDHSRKLGTVGRELANCELRVLDDNGDECSAGSVGEVVVRSESGMSGYYNRPDQTALTIRDGWIYTGDLGHLDEERFLTLVDRRRDVIMSGGENVYPAEIEHVMLSHPEVIDVAVVGAPDEKWGEVPVAFVVARPGCSPAGEGLAAWCSIHLARYKVPREWYAVTDLPRTANGKVMKQELRDRLPIV